MPSVCRLTDNATHAQPFALWHSPARPHRAGGPVARIGLPPHRGGPNKSEWFEQKAAKEAKVRAPPKTGGRHVEGGHAWTPGPRRSWRGRILGYLRYLLFRFLCTRSLHPRRQRRSRAIYVPIGAHSVVAKRGPASEDLLQGVAGLSHALDEAVELAGTAGIVLVAAVAFEVRDQGLREL